MANDNQNVEMAVGLNDQLEATQNLHNSKLVYALKNIQLERIMVEVEMHKKLFAIELEYQDKLAEFDAKRAKIVTGEHKPSEEECEYLHRDPADVPVDPPADQVGIPNFWLTILRNLEMFNDMVQVRDEPALEKLIDVRCVLLSEPDGFKLEFEFAENQFFTNKVLTKEYFFADSYDKKMPLEYDGPYISYARGSTIDWKSDEVRLTHQIKKKTLKNKNSKETKVVEKKDPCDSFFNFFAPPKERLEDLDDDENSEQEDARALLIADFDIGETIRHNVVPRAVIYYTGEGVEDDYDEEMGDFDEDFDEFDEDEDDDDLDEDEDEEGGGAGDNVKGGQGGKHAGGGGGIHKKKGTPKHNKGGKDYQGQAPPECKQQ